MVERTMSLYKSFRLKVFGATFFQKGSKNLLTQTNYKGEPPTRVLPLSLLCKEIHPLLRFPNDNYGAARPKPSPPFEKGGRKLSSVGAVRTLAV